MRHSLRSILFACGVLNVALHGQTWVTTQGTFEGKLTGVYGPLVAITTEKVSSLVPVNAFNDSDLTRIADFVCQQPAETPTWKSSKSRMAKALVGQLDILRNGDLETYDPGDRPEPEFYVVYFGAIWCGPCREFSPRLARNYQRLQHQSPGRFEVIFFSNDENRSEQERYVREVPMPWLVLHFPRRHLVSVVENWEMDSIPCVVVFTREGNVLFHSHHGDEYLGPDQPIEKLEELLRVTAPDNLPARRALYKLAGLCRIRRAGAKALSPEPYLIDLDPKRYQTLETKALRATLQIDEHGAVSDAQFEPKLPSAIDYQLVEDMREWLFLPAIRDGRAVASKIAVPLQFK